MFAISKKFSYILICCLSLFFGVKPVDAQSPNPIFDRLVVSDGLASVNCILEDKQGFVWFGGTHGLYRYDGYSFKVFLADVNDSFSLSNDNILCLYEDSAGYLWIGTMFGGLNCYNPIDESFVNVKNRSDNPLFNSQHITAVVEDNQGFLWVGTYGNGIYRYDKTIKTVQHISTRSKDHAISNNNIFSLLSENNNVWITTDSGVLDRFNTLSETMSHYRYSPKEFNSTRTGQRMCLDHRGVIWIGTEGNGLFKFDPKTISFKQFVTDKNKSFPEKCMITDLEEGRPGELWFSTDGDGLNMLNTSSGGLTQYKYNSSDVKAISNNSQYCLFIDSHLQLWLGMGDGSVNKSKNSPFEVYQNSGGTETNTLRFNVIVCLFAKKNKLWIGTGGGGLDCMDVKTGVFKNYSPKNDTPIPSNIIMSVIQDRSGTVWTGNFKDGVGMMYRHLDGFVALHSEVSSIKEALVFDLEEDDRGNIWIATYNNGLYKFDRDKQILTHVSNAYYTEKLSNTLLRLLFDSSKRLWIGTLKSGVHVLNPITGKFISPVGLQSATHLRNNPIKDIFEDISGNIWIATENAGLTKVASSGKIKQYTMSEGLPSNSIYGIIQDDKGYFWLSTNKGIVCFTPNSKTTLTYTTNDGLPTNDFESGAIVKADDGKLFFGSKKGLVSFYPDRINRGSSPINLRLTNLYVFNQGVDVGGILLDYKPLDSSMVYKKLLKLPYYLDNLTFEFAAPGHPHPYQINYEYKMENLDKKWIKAVKNRHVATYSNLPPGDYTFKLRAFEANMSGTNATVEKQIAVQITPVWWQTRLAFFIYLCLISGVLYWIYKGIRNRIRLKNQLTLEKYEHAKDEELNQSKLNFFTAISHELRTSLTLVLAPLSELASLTTGNNRAGNLITTVNHNARRLIDLTNQILDFRKIESGRIPLEISQVNITNFVQEISLAFRMLAEDQKIDFEVSVDTDMEGWLDAGKLEVILYNILSNAFKFGERKVLLEVYTGDKGQTLVIEVLNDGRGIPKEHLDRIFLRFYQADNKQNREFKGTGLGLPIVRSLIQLHKGTITVCSEPYKKTQFTVRLPISKNSYSEEEIKNALVPKKDSESLLSTPLSDVNIINSGMNSNVNKSIMVIVEDNSEILDLLKRKFEKEFRVLTASNGLAGHQKILENIPDIVISDIMMPLMNGLTLCKKLKTDEQTSHIPVILLTARGSHIYEVEGYKYGADDYITKPFDANLLQRRVTNLIVLRRKLREKFKNQSYFSSGELANNDIDELFLNKIVTIIGDNISNDQFTVSMLSKEIGMSRSVLYRKIKALTGENINGFIKSVRLSYAAKMLSQSNNSINEISDLTGFSSSTYFSTCFKKKFGKTPGAFRNEKHHKINSDKPLG